MDFTVGIVLWNLATTSNFFEFRDNRNFTFFKATGNAGHLTYFEWLTMCHVSGADLVKQGEPSGAHVDMWHLLIGWKIQSGWIKWIRKSNEPMMT